MSADDTAYVTALVKAHDLPRYYATLFAPVEVRADLMALYGFAAEVTRVADQVKEPALGEIRLKWWNEALIEAVRRQGPGDAPAVRALAQAVVRHKLPLAAFEALTEARTADLYSDAPATLTDLEGRMGETQSALFRMAAIIVGETTDTAEAAGHAGVAYGIAERLSRFASDRARGRTILPDTVLQEHGLTAASSLAPSPPAELHEAVAALADFARQHLMTARARAATLPGAGRNVFLPLAIVDPLIARIRRLGPAIGDRNIALSNLEVLLRIGAARLSGERRRT